MASPSTASAIGDPADSTVTLVDSLKCVILDVATVPVSTDHSSRIRAKDSSAVIIRRSRTRSSITGRTSGAWSRG
ncbi:hypothetical protein D9M72_317950 [compost metagenome]